MSAVFSLKPSYYEAIKRLTLEMSGVQLGDNHEFLIETRLSSLARQEGFEGLNQLIDELFATGQSRLAMHVVSALLERDTHFFDDRQSLDEITEICLPELQKRIPGETVRIMSYGCSSGQEPYSLAISIDKAKANFPDLNIEIVGVDYPSLAIDRARAGRYTHFEAQRGLPIRDLITYFDQVNEDWAISESIKKMVTFTDFHLLSDPTPLGMFHITSFRNRLNLYSTPAKIRIMRGLSSIIHPLGFLVMGCNETMGELDFGFDNFGTKNCVQQRRENPVIEEDIIDPDAKVPTDRKTFHNASAAPEF